MAAASDTDRRRPGPAPTARPALRLRVLWLFAVATLGCAQAPSAHEFRLDVSVHSDPGKPLAGARVLHGSRELGRTDAAGTVRLRLAGRAGEVIALQVACPEGYAAPAKPLPVVLRPLLDPSEVPQYRALCPPLLRSLVVAVRAKNGAGLPLLYMDREIARTDAEGAAHALLKVAPKEQVTLRLDTSGQAHKELRPKNPELNLIMPARDKVALFEQTFTRQAPKRKKRVRRRVGPVKIVSRHR